MPPKSVLKSIRADLDSENFSQAAAKASGLCEKDPQNYHAHLFLGLALDRLNDYEGSEREYTSAIKIKNDDKAAWQGLINLYESQGVKKLDLHGRAVTKLCQIFASTDEFTRAKAVVDKYINFVKAHGSKSQYRHALQLLLPSSPVYDDLEGMIPHPSQTYLLLADLAEVEEKEFTNHEIGERRTRLGARIDQVTIEVKLEAFRRSELNSLYQGVIDWSNDDDIRRTYEEKMLQRAYDCLLVFPAKKKAEQRKLVQKLSREMTIIRHPFELAWKIVVEWNDVSDISQLDVTVLRDFIELFPDDGLSKVLKGFLNTDMSPFPRDESLGSQANEIGDKGIDSPAGIQALLDENLLLMAEGLEQSHSSILSHRIMGEVYLSLDEFETAVDISRKCLSVMAVFQRDTGFVLRNTLDSMNITLGTALTSYQSPRYHPEAKGLFEDVLERDPMSTKCLLGLGLILEEDHDYTAAMDFLTRALKRNPSDVKVRSELSWCKAHNGDFRSALDDLEDTLVMLQSAGFDGLNLKAEILYRIGYCQWELGPSERARKDRAGPYSSFLASIQCDMNYAPAYTSLGIYYADYKKDKKRARRCFHKAFELSSSEIESAERIARDFAEQGEWDLVEAVARRVVDSGKAKPAPGSKRRGHSWPYAVLGVVEINRQQYPKSIVAFQSALRISPSDYQCWVGLGESYYNSGRYISATKAFQNSEMLESNLSTPDMDQVWFSKYMMANVKKELGDYEAAIAIFVTVLNMRPKEFGVSVTLLQTLTESSWKAAELGLFGEAAETAKRAIETGISVAKHHPDDFNLWKTMGDAFSIFSWIKDKVAFIPMLSFKSLLSSNCDPASFQILSDLDGIDAKFDALLKDPSDSEDSNANTPMNAAILAYKYALSVSAKDVHARAVAWYNLGWAEYRAHVDRNNVGEGSPKRENDGFLKASIRCFKRAIELEAGNSDFWNALGVATIYLSPKIAQHSFIRSLHLNERSALVWNNLGALYLLHNDYQLANEAFTHAQSADPDYSHAWLGQGLLAALFGDLRETRELITHAFGLGNATVVFPKQQYTISIFDHICSQTTGELSDLLQPLFALHQLNVLEPLNLPYRHLLALLAERIGDLSDAKANLEIVCSGVEAQYEENESNSALLKYAQGTADIARVQLGQLEYETAAHSAETALTLVNEEGVKESVKDWCQKVRLSAYLTAGLAYYYLKQMDEAIEMFRGALQEVESSPDVVCLLAQVLWAKGGEEERMVAREQLFDCVEKHPTHVGAVTLLGVIALLDMDKDAVEAVEADLQSMRTRGDLDIHEKAKVVHLLSGISALGFNKDPDVPGALQLIYQATASVMLSPPQPQGWMSLSVTSPERYPVEMAVRTTLQNIPPKGTLNAVDLCKAYAVSTTREGALRAVMIAPWSLDGWRRMNHCLLVE